MDNIKDIPDTAPVSIENCWTHFTMPNCDCPACNAALLAMNGGEQNGK